MFTTALLTGLFGSLHCVGMCGPLALSLPVRTNSNSMHAFRVVLYNMGRAITYALLGVLIGLLGQTFQLAGLQQFISIFSGVLLIGLVITPFIGKQFHLNWFQKSAFNQKVKGKIGQYFKKKGSAAYFMTGFYNGFLPCGLVYVAIAGALVQSNIWYSSAYMFLFGIGTMPLMMLTVFSKSLVPPRLRLKLVHVVPFFIFFLGTLFILRGLDLGIPFLSPQIGSFTLSDPAPVCH